MVNISQAKAKNKNKVKTPTRKVNKLQKNSAVYIKLEQLLVKLKVPKLRINGEQFNITVRWKL